MYQTVEQSLAVAELFFLLKAALPPPPQFYHIIGSHSQIAHLLWLISDAMVMRH